MTAASMDASSMGMDRAPMDEPLSQAALDRRTHARAERGSAQLVHTLCRLVEKATVPPWDRPYVMLPGALQPRNPVTGQSFLGQNRFVLLAHLWERNQADPRFLTAQHAAVLGSSLGRAIAARGDERPITILRPCLVGRGPAGAGENLTLADLPEIGQPTAPIDVDARVYLTAYSVFHASQLTNMPSAAGVVRTVRTDGSQRLEEFLGASSTHSGDRWRGASREAHYTTLLLEWHRSICGASALSGEDDVALGGAVFATIGMTLAGLQPYLKADIHETIARWREAEGNDSRRLAGAALRVLPLLDGLQAHIEGQQLQASWWASPSGGINAEMVPEDPRETTNVIAFPGR